MRALARAGPAWVSETKTVAVKQELFSQVRSTLKSIASNRSVQFPAFLGGRIPLRSALALACILFSATFAQARVHRSQAWAETQFTKAEAQRQTLNGRAEQARTRRQYEIVIASYRRIVLEAPTSSKADGSAFAVAELTAEMGRHFKDDMALYSAVREYKYLRREYPGSKHRIEALLAIGEIYKNDLGDDSDSRAAFEELIRRYPHSDLVKEARAELGQRDTESTREDGRDSKSTRSDGDRKASDAANVPKSERVNAPSAAATSSPPTSDSNPPDSSQTVRVTDVQYWSGPDYTRVTVSLEQDVQFESQRIPDPERIFFDLKNARLASVLTGQSYDVDDGLVRRIRVAQYKPGRARIVVETVGRASYNASRVLNPPRIVIDVHGNDDQQRESRIAEGPDSSTITKNAPLTGDASRVPKAAVNTRPKSDSPKTPIADDDEGAEDSSSLKPPITVTTVAGVKKVVVEAEDGQQQQTTDGSLKSDTKTGIRSLSRRSGTRTASAKARESEPMAGGDRSLIRTLGLRIGKIVIDPGHGGHDTGTIGPNGLLEKDLVLDVSKRLGKLLEARLGADVVFTRRDDTFIPLETRTSIANQEEADLFVSVHANSSRDQDARGVETYYLNFTSSPEALEVAARENAEADKSIHELQDLVKKIALKEKIEESKEFASDVQQSLHSGLAAKNTGIRDRGVKKAPFVVLIGANMPSILAEISFISNPGDEKRLKSADYRQRIAESLYRGIARYVNGLGGVKVASRLEKASAN
jgi:N-acetylmuramoyl-L-alanine amidase